MVLRIREVVLHGIGCVPGDEKAIRFWMGRWLHGEATFATCYVSITSRGDVKTRIECYWLEGSGWDMVRLNHYLPVNIIQRLFAVVVQGVTGIDDKLSWQGFLMTSFQYGRHILY